MRRTPIQSKRKWHWLDIPLSRAKCFVYPLVALTTVIASPTIRAGTVLANSFAPNPPSTKSPVALTATDLATSLPFVVTLKMRNFSELQERVGAGGVISISEMQQKYFPLASDYQAVSDWLKSQGLTVQPEKADRSSILALGSISQLQTALSVVFGKVNANGATYVSASNAPTVPDALAPAISAILGLQPEIRYHAHASPNMSPIAPHGPPSDPPSDPPNNTTPSAPPSSDVMVSDGGAIDSSQVSPSYGTGGYKIGDIQSVYKATNLNLSGKGQTIAIIMDDHPNDSDLNTFWHNCGVSQTTSNFVPISVNNGYTSGPPPNHGIDQLEATIDVSWAGGIAPGATIRLYEVPDLSQVSVFAAYQQIYDDIVKQHMNINILSLSYGSNEALYASQGFDNVPNNALLYPYDDMCMTNIASAGVTIFVSSGDGGSRPDASNAYYTQSAPIAPETPASATNVVAVGGTTLTVNSGTDTVANEVAWTTKFYKKYNATFGSGGGISGNGQTGQTKVAGNKQGSWQTNYPGIPATTRCVPDVALAADPSDPGYLVITGQYTYLLPDGTTKTDSWNSQDLANGTSWAAPTWAGFCALFNQTRAAAGDTSLGGLLTSLLYTTLAPTTALLRDIDSGNNGDYPAQTGYDLVTGLGVPNFATMAHELAAPFFTNEIDVGSGYYFLTLPNNTVFGFYDAGGGSNTFPLIYHEDMGYEYIFNANDSQQGIYMYDFATDHFFYTSTTYPWPYLYDFSLQATLYYYPDPEDSQRYTYNPRYFYNFSTGMIFTQ